MGRAFGQRFGCSMAGVLLAGLLCSPQLFAQQAQAPAGHWAGSIAVNGQTLGFEIDFVRADTGWTGVIAVPAQGAKDVPLIDIAVKGDSVVFGLSGAMGRPTFRGTVQDGGQTIAGAFTQGAVATTFTMARAADAAQKAAPPGAPVTPPAAKP